MQAPSARCSVIAEPAAGRGKSALHSQLLLLTYSTPNMTIVVDPSVTKGQGPRHPSPPPSQPPPSYAESATTQPSAVQPVTSSVLLAPNAHAGYGPTPISQQQQASLPYYDPRSVYSLQAAKRRARERFFGAVAWVMLILALLPVLAWMDMRIRSGWSAS